jgi:hypothetical protein
MGEREIWWTYLTAQVLWGTDFKRLNAKDQRRIFFCMSLSAVLQHCIEDDFVPIMEEITKTKCTGYQ